MKIGIVGPCGVGKTTLAQKLRELGYDAHDIAQEHSLVPTMWREIAQPNLVIYLDASLETIHARLDVNWDQKYLDELKHRIADAKAHADLIFWTDELSEEQVVDRVVVFLKERVNA